MPKAKSGKSSASSGTRKKHAARKAAHDEPSLPLPQTKKPKLKKGEKPPPKVKQYIPPVRPVPVQIDPLDALGLASQLDQDLVVILRRLGKKDAITKGKAIEELKVWVERSEAEAVLPMLPVWVSPLLVHAMIVQHECSPRFDRLHSSIISLLSFSTPLAVCVFWQHPSTTAFSSHPSCKKLSSSNSATF